MRQTIRFMLGDDERAVTGLRPTITVLDYLRTVERLCGTKEGCAEGDCGACTIVIGEPDGAAMRYRAANACILFLPALDGKQLLAVEHLRERDGALHPVQQAIVDCHASQCGFCTPGFVMSLFAAAHRQPEPSQTNNGSETSRSAINETLAGNLCRCTGYRPLVAAARVVANASPDRFDTTSKLTSARLRALDRVDALAIEAEGERYLAPRTLDELAGLCATFPEATLLAGGTDIGLWVSKLHRDMPRIIATEAVAGFAEIIETGAHLSIGAGATYDAALPALERHWPDFGVILRRLGSRQIRNRGTIGGNIANASPIGDTMPLLIALGATLVLHRAGDRRVMPLEDFFLGYRRTALRPGEFVERVDLPLPLSGQIFRAYKVSKRADEDIASVCMGFLGEIEAGILRALRIGVGGMAAIPARARETEHAVIGQAWGEAAVTSGMRALDAEFAPISDMRASASYRSATARNLLRKFWIETSSDTPNRTRLSPADTFAA